MPRRPNVVLRPRIRIVRDDGVIVFGPGKADLLAGIAAHRSIRGAAETLGMSYMRAWKLVRIMNEAFAEPLVEKTRGGAERGGARLTPAGRRVLRLYRAMERKAVRAVDHEWREIRNSIAK
ncbi:MAG: winged helix-turn-helix domain-containing protein [Thermoanaerobaculia bacterium]